MTASPRAPTRASALAALAALVAPVACVPSRVDDRLGGLDVTVDAESGAISIARDGRALLDTTASQAAFKDGQARFPMEFGMFLIEEDDAPFLQAAKLRVLAVEPGRRIEAALDDAGGVELAKLTLTSPGDGHVLVEFRAASAAVDRVKLGTSCAPDDHFAGLGAQTHDVDHRGQVVPLWVSEQGIGKLDTDETPVLWQVVGRRHTTHVPMPAMVTSRGSAILVDTPAFARFDLCATDEREASYEVWEGALRLHLFAGAEPLAALARMSDFVGRPKMPPPWELAPWNDAIDGSDAVRELAAFLREQQIPSSAIWFEDWRGGADSGSTYRLDEDWGPDPVLYPDFEALNADLHEGGFAPLVYFNTFVKEGADVDEALRAGRMLIEDEDGAPYLFDGADAEFAPTALVDLTDEAAVAFVKQRLQDALAQGARGWMADYAEWMPVEGAVLESGEDPALVHNRYPGLWQRTNVDAVAEAGLDDEVSIFFRSGHVGSQALASIVWAGDQRTSFQPDDGLPTVIPIGLGLMASGFFLFAHDIAGYQSSTNAPVDKELFFRWTELGAFTPVMRTHHGTHARANWNLRSDAETTAHWKRYAELHARLYPYLRGLARRFLDEGRPVWIPSGLLFPGEAEQWALKDQVFLGDGLLVAPVVEQGATSRVVRFPPGRYAPLLVAGAAVQGPASVEVDAPLGEIPVFLREGGIVPLTAGIPQSLFPAPPPEIEGDRVVYVGLGADGDFVEESGAGYRLQGDGTSTAGLALDADGAVVVTGDGRVEGDGFTFVLEGHPAGRTTRVIFR